MSHIDTQSSPLLFRALAGNGLFSLFSGAVLLLGGYWIAPLLGDIAFWVVMLVGAGLIPFGLQLLRAAGNGRIKRAEAVSISVMDFGWVAGSALLLLFLPDYFTRAGIIAVDAVALIVLVFALLQSYALLRVNQ
ncbi:MAG: hypothetical protein MJA83_02690 [Gammaproteobacteria bacterium]|nr:hypothetical protein [Gammaproteobacteria bacterium]